MSRIMFIDGTHREQIRVAVTEKGRVTEFDIESSDNKQTIGNIYLAKVTRVEPSLQAAFVEYGADKQAFLPFSEIHPDYYQIPTEDRQRLLEEAAAYYNQKSTDEEAADNGSDAQDIVATEQEASKTSVQPELVENSEEVIAKELDNEQEFIAETDLESDALSNSKDENESDIAQEDISCDHEKLNNSDNDNSDKESTEVAIKKPRLPRYKIQEVIRKRQILLIQVLKSERGNKGASVTTYLSLAGRYCVLMPNTACGGGISRKISNIDDRKKLRSFIKELEVPQDMGLIIRTAGLQRTKAELKRDYEYLLRLWDNVRQLTMTSTAPALVYEEGNLIKRALRDIYTRDTSKVMVQGEHAHKQAHDIMKMIMPSAARSIYHYRDPLPLFSRYQVERQLDALTNCDVVLKSGGYLVINHTEALIAIDINSGKSTNTYSIEETAYKTNLEAAEEIARQLRLRDLAGLIVIDFIDMESNSHIRAVERKMRECLKSDKARLQTTSLSNFGLMEMTRQRLRPAMKDLMSVPCSHCQGSGYVPSLEMSALRILRAVFEEIAQKKIATLSLTCSIDIAHYLLNKKRQDLSNVEAEYSLEIDIIGASKILGTDYEIQTQAKQNTTHHEDTYQDPISDTMGYQEEKTTPDNDLDAQESQPKKSSRSKNQKRRRGGKNTDISQEESTAHPESVQTEDTPESDTPERPQNKRSKFNRKRNRRDRFSREPENYVTNSGNNVLIENPISVKNQAQTHPDFQNMLANNNNNALEVSVDIQPEESKETIIDNVIIENIETVISKSDDFSEIIPVTENLLENTQQIADDINTVPDLTLASDTISESSNETIPSRVIEESPEQKPARRGWWRSRFGL